MKKVIFCFILLLCGIIAIYMWNKPHYTKPDTIYLNANDEVSYNRLKKLSKALNKEGYRTVLSNKNNLKSGLINIYASNTDQRTPLPPVQDKKAINFLWVPLIEENVPEPLRQFDVIVVESFSSFSHLKAVNFRTVYIPEAIDITYEKDTVPNNKAMYYGQKQSFSLSLYLSNAAHLALDIFGSGFEKEQDQNKFIKEKPKSKEFSEYTLTLIDQTDEEIAKELINERIIETLEAGGLPYVRYNNGLARIFGDALPMYMSEQEFLSKARLFLDNPKLAVEHRQKMRNAAKKWDSQSQAKKFDEIFEIMKKKLK